nr:PREDICTED: uncharacterized protein C17orf64 homolog isoform X2 [Latimeria chalumnae]|eukprot:XP_014342862.1 PREDICTED: uncharacterized protein C17orf64 homolog isoform X2 [Latimeria chalumnae]
MSSREVSESADLHRGVSEKARSAKRSCTGNSSGTKDKCKEYLRPMKRSLKQLDLPEDLSKEIQLKSTKKNLIRIGTHINIFLQEYCRPCEVRHWKKMLWKFVSLFSEFEARKLRKLYKYAQNNEVDKFMKIYWNTNPQDSSEDPGAVDMQQLYRAWGLKGDSDKPTTRKSESHKLHQSQGGTQTDHQHCITNGGCHSPVCKRRKKIEVVQTKAFTNESYFPQMKCIPYEKSWNFPDPDDMKHIRIPRFPNKKPKSPESPTCTKETVWMYKSPLEGTYSFKKKLV